MCSQHAYITFFCSGLIPPLYQQVARTLGEEGQHTQLQHRWQRQEGKHVDPRGFLQSKHSQNYIQVAVMVYIYDIQSQNGRSEVLNLVLLP